jgi:polyribonucleotide nucleotidyltransferase
MIKSTSTVINGQTVHIESGRIARQASGSAVVTMGETVVLVTVVATDQVREGIDFLPLTVEYQEMSYAGGRIPGNYFRRDMGRPTEKETLTARLIDRPLRPLFQKGWNKETQVIATVLSTDKENEADVLAVVGASAALEVSHIPFRGPIASVRVGRVDGKFVANPTMSQQEQSDINLIVAGSRSAVVMVEGGGRFVSESDMIDAIFYGHEALQPLLDIQEELKKEAGKAKVEMPAPEADEGLEEKVRDIAAPLLQEVISTAEKMKRQDLRAGVIDATLKSLSEEYPDKEAKIKVILEDIEKKMVRRMMLEEGKRIDGRSFTEVRPIECIVGFSPGFMAQLSSPAGRPRPSC